MKRAIELISIVLLAVCSGLFGLAIIAAVFVMYGAFFGLIGGGAVWAYRLIA